MDTCIMFFRDSFPKKIRLLREIHNLSINQGAEFFTLLLLLYYSYLNYPVLCIPVVYQVV